MTSSTSQRGPITVEWRAGTRTDPPSDFFQNIKRENRINSIPSSIPSSKPTPELDGSGHLATETGFSQKVHSLGYVNVSGGTPVMQITATLAPCPERLAHHHMPVSCTEHTAARPPRLGSAPY